MVWERFRCNVDCEKDPQNCIRFVVELCELQFVALNQARLGGGGGGGLRGGGVLTWFN